MAENKRSFIAYIDWGDTFNALPDDMAGKLAKHLWSYVKDENPVSDDPLINVAFAQIKATLKRDLKKWEDEIETKSNAGKLGNLKRWNPDLFKKVSDGQLDVDEACSIADSRKTSHTDSTSSQTVGSIAVNDSVSVNDSDIDNEETKVFNFKKSLIDLGVDKKIVSDWLTIRRKKKAFNSEIAFKEIEKQIKLSGLSANDCIKKSVEESWAGFKVSWIKNEKTKPNKKDDYDRSSFHIYD